MRSIQIASLNAWGGAIWPDLGAWVETMDADVLCLQEVIRAPEDSPEWLIYSDPNRRLDQRSDLFADISQRLPSHQRWFSPAARGPLNDEAGRQFQSEHGIAMWVSRNLAVTHVSSVFIHGAFRHDGWGAEPVPRTMQMARIADPGTGAALVVAHFHGLREDSGKGDTPARLLQADRVADALKGFCNGRDERLVLGGDFNILPDSAFFSRMADLGLSDLVVGHGILDTRTALYSKPQRHANYMLVRENVAVDGFSAPSEPVVSDHRPLILRTRL